MVLFSGQVVTGLQQPGASYQTGSQTIISLGKSGELLASEYQGKYYSLCYAGRVYQTCNQTVATLSTLSTTYTGLLIANPFGSGVNSALLQCMVALASAPGGIATIQHQGINLVQKTAITNTTPNTVYNALLGGAASNSAVASVSATLPTAPIAFRAVGCGVNATGTATTAPVIVDDIAGGMILQPGTYVGLGYVTTAPAVIASYHWAEIPQ